MDLNFWGALARRDRGAFFENLLAQQFLIYKILAGFKGRSELQAASFAFARSLELELLTAGGLFKRVKAADKPEDSWISAILIRGDGITLVTQRVRVEP